MKFVCIARREDTGDELRFFIKNSSNINCAYLKGLARAHTGFGINYPGTTIFNPTTQEPEPQKIIVIIEELEG